MAFIEASDNGSIVFFMKENTAARGYNLFWRSGQVREKCERYIQILRSNKFRYYS